MNNARKVYDLLKANPRQILCDDCLGLKAGVDRHEVNTIAHTLALFSKEFRRQRSSCSERCSNRMKESTEAI
jgi:hypothetical protein